jgi:hypothetical protein
MTIPVTAAARLAKPEAPRAAGRDAQAARVPGISPNTARAALAGDGPPRGVRRPAGSVADEVEPRV